MGRHGHGRAKETQRTLESRHTISRENMNDGIKTQTLSPDPFAGLTPEDWERLQEDTEAQEDAQLDRLNRLGAAFFKKRKAERERTKDGER